MSLEQEDEEIYDVVRNKVDLMDWSWLVDFGKIHIVTHWFLMNDNFQRNSGTL